MTPGCERPTPLRGRGRLRLFLLFDLKELEASTAVVLDQGEESLPVRWMRTKLRTPSF